MIEAAGLHRWLACPACRRDFSVTAATEALWGGGEVGVRFVAPTSERLKCPACGLEGTRWHAPSWDASSPVHVPGRQAPREP